MKLVLGAAIGAAALVAALGAHAGAPGVPAGFSPDSVGAVGSADFWVLGTVPCRSSRCTALVRTTDGGATFTRLAAPRLPTGSDLIRRVWFADLRNGFASSVGDYSYATHDGGRSWHRLPIGTVSSLAIVGGRAFAVTASCGRDACASFRLRVTRVSGGGWRLVRLGFGPFEAVARGSNVWVLGSAWHRDKLARSRDGGRTFATGSAPCDPDLSGALSPTAGPALWLVCATGLESVAWRSTNRGATFRPFGIPGCCANALSLAAASGTVAVAARNVAGRGPLRTTDGGRTWRPVSEPSPSIYWPWIGFTDGRVGVALVQVRPTGPLHVWQTSNGGATWRDVPLR